MIQSLYNTPKEGFFMKTFRKTLIVLAASLLLAVSGLAAALPFADVAADAWYADGVAYVYTEKLMTGTAETAFSPDSTLNRAELTTVLWRMAGSPVVNYALPFTDVPDEAWYTEAVRFAAAEKITFKASGAFAPDETLTREETAAMLYAFASLCGADTAESADLSTFADASAITEAYLPAMRWAVAVGLVTGTGETSLSPKDALTRAQTAVLLQRFAALADKTAPLSLWTKDAPAAKALVAYIEAVTDETSPDYIPVVDRVAVFDLDGTLFCETDPNYFDYTLLKYRVLEDPDYKEKASDFEKEVANKIKEQNETGKSFSGLEVDHGKAVASAFKGMTVEAFNAYIQEFKKQPMPSYTGMKRGDGWYLPMLQIVDYLKANDFTVYVVSGTDRLIVRGIAYDSPLGLPARQLIGSDETIVSDRQGDTDGLNYVFTEGDELVLGGDFLIKNLKMNKVSVIMQEIGIKPVLSFGNSTGDSSMAEFVTSGNRYKSLAFMLCCDDTERENGSKAKADKMFALCEEFDWIPVSMKNDWVTIYGDNVTYHAPKAEEQPAA